MPTFDTSDTFDQLKDDVRSANLSKLKTFFSLMMGRVPQPYTENPVFQDPEGAQKPFLPHYDQHIKQEIQEFEHQRIAMLKSLSQRSFCSLCLVVAGAVMGLVFMVSGTGIQLSREDSEGVSNLLQLIVMVLIGLAAWCYVPIRRYQSMIKQKIFPKIFKFFGPDFHYSLESPVSIDILKPSGILPDYDRAILQDCVQGAYKNVALDIVCAHLKKKKYTNEKRHKFVFKGIFICLSMNKSFSGQTIVKKDSGLLMNWAMSAQEGLEKVTLEDPIFEKKFEVFSSDQIEARYLLTTSFMERLLQLSELFQQASLQCSFYDEKLLLMIPLKQKYFEVASIFQPVTFTHEIQKILQDMNQIFKIIDVLKLDQKIGL